MDSDTGEYAPMLTDVPYIIGSISETQRDDSVSITDALRNLEKEGIIQRVVEGTALYFRLGLIPRSSAPDSI